MKRKGRRTMANHLRHIADCLESDGMPRFAAVLRQAAKEIFDLKAEVSTLKARITGLTRSKP